MADLRTSPAERRLASDIWRGLASGEGEIALRVGATEVGMPAALAKEALMSGAAGIFDGVAAALARPSIVFPSMTRRDADSYLADLGDRGLARVDVRHRGERHEVLAAALVADEDATRDLYHEIDKTVRAGGAVVTPGRGAEELAESVEARLGLPAAELVGALTDLASRDKGTLGTIGTEMAARAASDMEVGPDEPIEEEPAADGQETEHRDEAATAAEGYRYQQIGAELERRARDTGKVEVLSPEQAARVEEIARELEDAGLLATPEEVSEGADDLGPGNIMDAEMRMISRDEYDTLVGCLEAATDLEGVRGPSDTGKLNGNICEVSLPVRPGLYIAREAEDEDGKGAGRFLTLKVWIGDQRNRLTRFSKDSFHSISVAECVMKNLYPRMTLVRAHMIDDALFGHLDKLRSKKLEDAVDKCRVAYSPDLGVALAAMDAEGEPGWKVIAVADDVDPQALADADSPYDKICDELSCIELMVKPGDADPLSGGEDVKRLSSLVASSPKSWAIGGGEAVRRAARDSIVARKARSRENDELSQDEQRRR